eukprot:scaffold56361_cov71-Cyclotella_meneghiniana.AAC.5
MPRKRRPNKQYNIDSQELLKNSFLTISDAAIEDVFHNRCRTSFTRAYRQLTRLQADPNSIENLAPDIQVLRKPRPRRKKTQLEITDVDLLAEIASIPELNQSEVPMSASSCCSETYIKQEKGLNPKLDQNYVGSRVAKYFKTELYFGTVSINNDYYHVVYDDGDEEDLDEEDFHKALELYQTVSAVSMTLAVVKDDQVKKFQREDLYWEVESVMGRRVRKGREEYLIRWKGCGDKNDTWEPADNLCDAALEEASRCMGSQKNIKEENKERKQQGRSDDEPTMRGKAKTKQVLKEIQNVQMRKQDCLNNKRVNANNKKAEAKKTIEVITSIQPSRAKKKQSPIFESKDAPLEELRLIHSPQSKCTSFQDDDSNFIGDVNCSSIEVENKSQNTNQSIQHDQAIITKDEEQMMSSIKGTEYIPRDQRKVQNLIMQYENKVAAVGSVQRTLDPPMSSTSIQQDSLNYDNNKTLLKEKEPQLRSSDNCSFFSGLTRLFTGGRKPQNCLLLDANHL